MQVSASILDGCGESFIAEASTHFFADTGLMALLCCHNQVLWLVNMMSTGEKQYYALALLKRLFKHLPRNFTVGCLYDIGCQLEHSCWKWSFLNNNILPCLTFAISVFHVYGHQWPCQIIYHPCKCIGFGLSDEEGSDTISKVLALEKSVDCHRTHVNALQQELV
ncbi:hypothetical protein BS17DRAFT_795520 [Gyrodon lividus]|nr:hypothetical protein BS17DRAFT_795520 [Gyrodon lividus]